MLYSILAALFGIASVGNSKQLVEKPLKAQVTSLPGQPPVSFQQYAGYINIDQSSNKSIFYYFQESDTTVQNAPVFLWTNGGPGCSGLLGGFIEQGAFRIQANGSLILNPGRWNQRVHMLFIEQPAGVGFSFSDNKNDYNTGDSQAVADMYSFILGWFAAFPNYKKNDFYISSESYGGHYMPQLAKYIVQHNDGSINFQGFLVGNPYTDPVENAKGMYDTFFGHSLVSLPAWKQYYSVCKDGEDYNDTDCQNQMAVLEGQVGSVYLYGLDWPVCNEGQSLYGFKQQQWFIEKVLKPMGRGHGFPGTLKSHHRVLSEQELGDLFEPCATDYLTTYLNRQDVQTALHAVVGTEWTMCSNDVVWNASDFNTYMEPIYQFLIDGNYNLHITVYSGDDDSVCGTLGTQSWLWNLGYTKANDWTSWTQNEPVNGPQVAGYHIQFSHNNKIAISFVTIHSAGHQVPWYNAERAYLLLEGYLGGRW